MNASEPAGPPEPQRFGVTININSPNNCIVSGDRIDISIHMGHGQKCETANAIELAKVPERSSTSSER